MNTDRIRCAEAIEKLPLFVGGDLDPEVQSAVRLHLEGCRSCSVRAGAAGRGRRALLDALQERGDLGAQPDLWTGIRAALVTEGRIRGVGTPSRARDGSGASPCALPGARRPWMPRALAPLAAAAAVVLVLQAGGFLFSSDGPGSGAPLGTPHASPVNLVEHTIPPGQPGVEVVPVSLVDSDETPRAGFLRRVPADEAAAEQMLLPFRPRVERRAPGDPGISLTGYH